MPSISGETGEIGDWGADLGEVLGIDGVVGVPASGGVAGTAIRIGPAASPAGADRIMQVPPPFPNFGSVRPLLGRKGCPRRAVKFGACCSTQASPIFAPSTRATVRVLQ